MSTFLQLFIICWSSCTVKIIIISYLFISFLISVCVIVLQAVKTLPFQYKATRHWSMQNHKLLVCLKAVFVPEAIITLCFPPPVDSDKIQAHQSWLWYEHDNTSQPLWQLPFVSSLFLLIMMFSIHGILSFQQSKLIKASCDMSKFNTSHQLWWFALLTI